MLVLTRKKDDTILIGEDIVIAILDVHNGKVRVGIRAPKDVEVDRPEVRKRKIQNAFDKEVELSDWNP